MTRPPDAPPDAPGGEEDFASLFAASERAEQGRRRRDPGVGEQVKGRVVAIGGDAAFVEIGAKAEAMIELGELRDAQGALTIAVGDELTARVVEVGGKAGCVVLKRTLGRGAEGRAELADAHAHGIPVEGVVSGVNKGGLEVTIAGTRAFCPVSQIDVRPVADPAQLVGQKLAFRITRYEEGGRNIVLSRRALLEEEARGKADETWARLKPGVVLRGTVVSLRPFGAFVDLGGVEGMIHVSELGHARVGHPQEVLAVGQSVEVQVLRAERSPEGAGSRERDRDRERDRVALSLKSLEADPWSDVAARFPAGANLSGRVARLESFGAFVELAPGVDGLLHVSELGAATGKRVAHPRDVLKEGETIDVHVAGVDGEKKRVSLGWGHRDVAAHAAATAAARAARPPAVGDVVDATVDQAEAFGAFVRWGTPPGGGRGLVPGEELGLPPGADARRRFPAGTTLRAAIIAIDARGRYKLSLRAAADADARADYATYTAGASGAGGRAGPRLGTLGDLLRSKDKGKKK